MILTSVRFQLKSVVDLGRTQTYRASSTVADGVNEQRGGGLVGGVALNLIQNGVCYALELRRRG
jgi:hypothetical protein